jgi:hypothetical protein
MAQTQSSAALSELRLSSSGDDPGRPGTGPANNSAARYKLMSPAKLPISRATCITIPPGLSPTSFLESPVLLSNNMKVRSGSMRRRFGFVLVLLLEMFGC